MCPVSCSLIILFSSDDSIDFDQFKDGMKKMAEKKYADEGGSSDEKLDKLEKQIIQNADDWL